MPFQKDKNNLSPPCQGDAAASLKPRSQSRDRVKPVVRVSFQRQTPEQERRFREALERLAAVFVRLELEAAKEKET